MAVDYPGAIDMMLDPNHFGFSSNAHLKIVDHATGGDMTIEDLHAGFMASGKSTHFGIGRDGRVAQFIALNRGAGGNCCSDVDVNGNYVCSAFWLPLIAQYGNLNLCTISIEHCNDSNNDLPPTPEQELASNQLNLWLCQQYNLTTDDIHSHHSLDPINKARCPGAGVNFTHMFDFINLALGGKELFTNTLCINVWNSFFVQQGLNIPVRDTGIFNSWRSKWIAGDFKGCPVSAEYQVTMPNSNPGVAQNFAGGTCLWDLTNSIPTWL